MDSVFNRMLGVIERSPSQEKIMTYLRSYGYKFIPGHLIPKIFGLKMADEDVELSFMVRRTKIGDKLTGNWDQRVVFAFKIVGKKQNNFAIYKDGRLFKRVFIPWKDKGHILFRKIVKKVVFPDYLTYDERRKWRSEDGKVKRNPNYKAPDWYYSAAKDVRYIDTPK